MSQKGRFMGRENVVTRLGGPSELGNIPLLSSIYRLSKVIGIIKVGRGVLTAPRQNRRDALELAHASPRRAGDSDALPVWANETVERTIISLCHPARRDG